MRRGPTAGGRAGRSPRGHVRATCATYRARVFSPHRKSAVRKTSTPLSLLAATGAVCALAIGAPLSASAAIVSAPVSYSADGAALSLSPVGSFESFNRQLSRLNGDRSSTPPFEHLQQDSPIGLSVIDDQDAHAIQRPVPQILRRQFLERGPA